MTNTIQSVRDQFLEREYEAAEQLCAAALAEGWQPHQLQLCRQTVERDGAMLVRLWLEPS